MKQFPSLPIPAAGRGEMTQETTVEIRDNAYETTPVFWWGWPTEALLADTTEMADRVEQADQENSLEYAALYFVS